MVDRCIPTKKWHFVALFLQQPFTGPAASSLSFSYVTGRPPASQACIFPYLIFLTRREPGLEGARREVANKIDYFNTVRQEEKCAVGPVGGYRRYALRYRSSASKAGLRTTKATKILLLFSEIEKEKKR
jgi:hypothetical protein